MAILVLVLCGLVVFAVIIRIVFTPAMRPIKVDWVTVLGVFSLILLALGLYCMKLAVTFTADGTLERYSRYVADNTNESTVFLRGGDTSSEIMTDKLLDKYYLIQQEENFVQLVPKHYDGSKVIEEYKLNNNKGFVEIVGKYDANKQAAYVHLGIIFVIVSISSLTFTFSRTDLQLIEACAQRTN